MRCTQQAKTSLEKSLDGVAEMANATETQAGCMDPDFHFDGEQKKSESQKNKTLLP